MLLGLASLSFYAVSLFCAIKRLYWRVCAVSIFCALASYIALWVLYRPSNNEVLFTVLYLVADLALMLLGILSVLWLLTAYDARNLEFADWDDFDYLRSTWELEGE